MPAPLAPGRIRAYPHNVARLLERSTAVPPVADWLDRLGQLPRHRGLTGATAVREARDELP